MPYCICTEPSGAPEMFPTVAGEREVTFSWSPLPVTQHRGYLRNYTLSCSPSPSSLPQSPSQSGPLTATGFSPDTSYSCSVVANNGLGSGPPSTTTFTTLPDCMWVSGIFACLCEVISFFPYRCDFSVALYRSDWKLS